MNWDQINAQMNESCTIYARIMMIMARCWTLGKLLLHYLIAYHRSIHHVEQLLFQVRLGKWRVEWTLSLPSVSDVTHSWKRLMSWKHSFHYLIRHCHPRPWMKNTGVTSDRKTGVCVPKHSLTYKMKATSGIDNECVSSILDALCAE